MTDNKTHDVIQELSWKKQKAKSTDNHYDEFNYLVKEIIMTSPSISLRRSF